MIDRSMNLTLGRHAPPAIIPVSQYDDMWRWRFTVYYQDQVWTIPSGSTVIMTGVKPDGNVFAFSGTVSGNTAVVSCDVQMTACAGRVIGELRILDSTGRSVGTSNLLLAVEPSPDYQDGPQSETVLAAYGQVLQAFGTEISQLQSLIDRLGGATADIPGIISDWLEENITQPTTPAIDSSLSVSGAAADAKAAGNADTALRISVDHERTRASIAGHELASFAEVGKNKLNTADLVEGYYYSAGSGKMNANASYACVLIPVEPSTAYVYRQSAGGDYICVFFNSKMEKSGDTVNGGLSANTDRSITTLADTAYIGLSINITHAPSDLMLRLSGTSNTYEPYKVSLPSLVNDLSLMQTYSTSVRAANWSTVLPDADDAESRMAYVLLFARGATDIPQHLPVTTWTYATTAVLMTLAAGAAAWVQLFASTDGIWIRRKTSETAYGAWTKVGGGPTKHTITVKKDGTGNYTKLIDAVNSITDASEDNPYEIRIYPGTYDIIDEVYGTGEYSAVQGIILPDYVDLVGVGKREEIILSAVFNATATTTAVSTAFSTLNLKYNNRIANLTLLAKNCRYALHDESGNSFKNYHRVVENCVFHHLGVDNGDLWQWCDGYGHGLSGGAVCEFTGCEFITDVTVAGNGGYICHDNTGFSAPARLRFTGCSFRNTANPNNCTVRIGTVGSGLDNTITMIGCELTGTENNLRLIEESGYTGAGCDWRVTCIACKDVYPLVRGSTDYTPMLVATEYSQA